ncbi:MAG TPA: GNVR domain-containing protein [Acidobacteriaceae bacterium]|jgi:uncharacterized protein involved in exopolysaccharide biosynthesis
MSSSSLDQVQAAETALSARDIVRLVLRSKRTLGAFVVAAVVMGALLAAFLSPFFIATASFLPPQSGSSSSNMLAQLGGLGALAGLSGGGGLKSPEDLYIGLLQTQTVEDAMVKRYDLMEGYHAKRLSEARRQLEEHTAIDGKSKDGIVRISVTDKSPARAAELANGYLEQLQKMSGSLAVSEASQRRLFLEQQLEQSKDKLAAAEESLKATEEKTGVIQVDAQARALIESAAALRAQVAAKEVEVQSMRTYSGSGNANLIQAEQELSSLRGELQKLSGQANGSSSLVPEKGQLTEAGLEYVRNVREVKYQETLFEILARQYEAARLDEAKEGALVQVVDRATLPDYRAGPKRLPILLASVVLGFSLGIIWVFFRAYRKGIVRRPSVAS